MNNLVAACNDCNGEKSDKVEHRVNYVNTHWIDSL